MKVSTKGFCVKLPDNFYYVSKGHLTDNINRAKVWEHEETAKALNLGEVIPVVVNFTLKIEDLLGRITNYEVIQLCSNVPVP